MHYGINGLEAQTRFFLWALFESVVSKLIEWNIVNQLSYTTLKIQETNTTIIFSNINEFFHGKLSYILSLTGDG